MKTGLFARYQDCTEYRITLRKSARTRTDRITGLHPLDRRNEVMIGIDPSKNGRESLQKTWSSVQQISKKRSETSPLLFPHTLRLFYRLHLHRQLRKVTKGKSNFPSDESLQKIEDALSGYYG